MSDNDRINELQRLIKLYNKQVKKLRAEVNYQKEQIKKLKKRFEGHHHDGWGNK